MNRETPKIKSVKERDNLDLLNLVCELSGRLAMWPSKHLHDAFWEARKELESRLSPLTEVKEQQGELLPEEKEVINEWRRARLSVRNGKFGVAEERIEQVKKIIGEATDYYNDKTEIPELL